MTFGLLPDVIFMLPVTFANVTGNKQPFTMTMVTIVNNNEEK